MFPSTAAAPAFALPSLRAALRQAAELAVAFATLESYTLDDVLPARPAALRTVPSEAAEGHEARSRPAGTLAQELAQVDASLAAGSAHVGDVSDVDETRASTGSAHQPREVALWEAPADDWLAEVRPIGAGPRAPRGDDDATGTPTAAARRPGGPRRPDALLAAAAQASGWPVAGPHLVRDAVTDRPGAAEAAAQTRQDAPGTPATSTTSSLAAAVGWPDAPAPRLITQASCRPEPFVPASRAVTSGDPVAVTTPCNGVTSLAGRRAQASPGARRGSRRRQATPAEQLSLLA